MVSGTAGIAEWIMQGMGSYLTAQQNFTRASKKKADRHGMAAGTKGASLAQSSRKLDPIRYD
jgi:hypothetical protein